MKPSKEKPNGSEEEGEEEGNKEVELYEKSRRKPAFFIRKVKFDNAPDGLIADAPTGMFQPIHAPDKALMGYVSPLTKQPCLSVRETARVLRGDGRGIE